jgi:hypothetical protein
MSDYAESRGQCCVPGAWSREEVGMAMTDYGSRPFSAVEIVTQTYVVTARCGGLTEDIRLVDLLNNPEVSHLQLFEAKVRGLAGSGEVMATEGYMFVDKMRMVFASTVESPEEVARRQKAHEIDRVEKDRYNVLVFAAPFRITGNVHVVRGADPRAALPRLFNNFLAVTEASVTYEHDDSLVWDKNFLVVSGRHIEMIYSSTTQAARGTLNGGNAA